MLKKYIPQFLKNFLKRVFDCSHWDPWFTRTWSQEGEDMVLRRIFDGKKGGVYVDVGAHHPKRFSNTYYFYRSGWSGINIDAMPGSMRLFNKWRPRDINMEIGVALTAGSLDYHVFNEPALNSFSAKLSEERVNANNHYRIKEIIKVNTLPLKEILDKHLDEKTIDFLSVDVEGFDLEVLKSNDWTKYRPRFVLAEVLKTSLHELENAPIFQFMKEVGYVIYAKQMNTAIFKDEMRVD